MRFLRWIVALGLVVLLGVLSVSASDGLFVRIAHLSPGAPAVDIFIDGQKVITDLSYKSVTPYLPLMASSVEVVVVPAGEEIDASVTPEPIPLAFPDGRAGYFTVAAVGLLSDNSFELFILPGDGAPPMGEASAGDIRISGAFARPTAPMGGGQMNENMATPMGGMENMNMGGMGDVSAVYMTIENMGSTSERLIAVKTDAANMPQIHQTTVENNMARMEEVQGGVEIPAGGKVELMPGGLHIMLMDVTRPLAVGDSLTVTLQFESGLEITLLVPVKMIG